MVSGELAHDIRRMRRPDPTPVKTDGIAELNQTLDKILESSEARHLLGILEETLAPLLPTTVTYGNITVLRRR